METTFTVGVTKHIPGSAGSIPESVGKLFPVMILLFINAEYILSDGY